MISSFSACYRVPFIILHKKKSVRFTLYLPRGHVGRFLPFAMSIVTFRIRHACQRTGPIVIQKLALLLLPRCDSHFWGTAYAYSYDKHNCLRTSSLVWRDKYSVISICAGVWPFSCMFMSCVTYRKGILKSSARSNFFDRFWFCHTYNTLGSLLFFLQLF